MVWSKKLIKNTYREILHSKSRFLSIVLIVFLGCSFYVGLNATKPNMMDTVHSYYEKQNLMDLHVRSSNGFDDDVLGLFTNIEPVRETELSYSQDVVVTKSDQKIVVTAFSYHANSQINQFRLTSGRLPKSDDEILMEDNYKMQTHFALGDTVSIESGTSLPLLVSRQEYTIVGFVRSPLYISYDRGFTNIGDGTVVSYISIPVENFISPRYTDLYITLNHDYSDVYSEEYKAFISNTKEKLELLSQDYIQDDSAIWLFQDRTSLPGYSYFVNDVDKIEKISAVIPVFFIFIAILVCLTSMTRMVDEERLEVGTLCALGCSKLSIVMKYIVYTLLATVIGSFLGGLLGSRLLPTIIYNAFDLYYLLPSLKNSLRWHFFLIGVLASVVSILFATILASYQLLKSKPSVLMRPKSPILGKKILLERLGLLWNRLTFNLKMTMRNIFRYKKRGIITVIGVAGCAGLMLTGFGLQNAITEISEKQFGNIFVYDGTMILQTLHPLALKEQLENENRIESFYFYTQEVVDIELSEKTIEVYLSVFEGDEYSNFIVLKNRKTQKALELNLSGVVINEGLANKYGYRVGDPIEVIRNNQKYQLPVAGITENYTYNYIYISNELYRDTFGEESFSNQVLFKTKKSVDERILKMDLLDHEEVYTVRLTSENYAVFSDSIQSIKVVVLVVIVFSAALALIVVYNLSFINLTERQKELSTFKVLGMTNFEVANYLGRENIICTMAGIGVGLYFGSLFERYILSIIETEQIMFVQTIRPLSYVLTVCLTIFFTVIVNTFVRIRIDKLDLVEAMKAVE